MICRSSPGFSLRFGKPITVIVGSNGSGKSTLLEALAGHCGFGQLGGSRDHAHAAENAADGGLVHALRFSCLPKVTNGFFFRAESFFGYSNWLDDLTDQYPGAMEANYGSRHLLKQSHGESFLALFCNRLGSAGRSFYVLDEPESALSPARQLEFVKLVHGWHRSGRVQAVIATHSPILMAYPHADVLHIGPHGIDRADYRDLEHYRVMRDFLADPGAAYAALLEDSAEGAPDEK